MNFYIVEIIANGGGTMKEKIIKTCRENGFLIFLFICVCIVAVGTISIVLNGVDKGSPNNNLVILDNPLDDETFDSIETIEGIRNSSLDLDTGEITLDEGYEVTQTEPSSQEEPIDELDSGEEVFFEGEEENDYNEIEFIDNYVEEPPKPVAEMIMPVNGKIITDFSKDKLIYSETLEEWRAHLGIDINAKSGANVIAVLDGTVSKVYEDSLWGKTIIIDHGNGLETKYSNLGTLEMVKPGIEVRQGDNISVIGKTAQIELLMDEHLHFEVIKNQKTADPRSIIR